MVKPGAGPIFAVPAEVERVVAALGSKTVADLLGVSRSQPSRWRRGEEHISRRAGLCSDRERANLWTHPHHWCQAHHLLPWINGGSTDLCNLCLRHHHLIHEGGFGLARGPTGELIFTRPDGSVIDPNPGAA